PRHGGHAVRLLSCRRQIARLLRNPVHAGRQSYREGTAWGAPNASAGSSTRATWLTYYLGRANSPGLIHFHSASTRHEAHARPDEAPTAQRRGGVAGVGGVRGDPPSHRAPVRRRRARHRGAPGRGEHGPGAARPPAESAEAEALELRAADVRLEDARRR